MYVAAGRSFRRVDICVCVNPDQTDFLFLHTPLLAEKLCHAGYRAGCDLLKLTGDSASGFKAEKVYANTNMVNHHGGVVLYEGHIYGYSDGKGWVCQNFKTGRIVWPEPDMRKSARVSMPTNVLFEMVSLRPENGAIVESQ